ncbi:MAG TPA: hypothetical protein DCS97_00055 [Planctomycetes bacterium]|nr:hypothetical protein [Planctomycetota bacterium]
MFGELILASLLAADGPEIRVLGPARQEGLLRVAVSQAGLPAEPVQILAELQDAGGTAAEASAELADASALTRGIVLVLAPTRTGNGAMQVLVTLTQPVPGGAPLITSQRCPVATPDAVLAAAVAAAEQLRRSGERDPQPWLWAEQAAELLAGGASSASASEVEAIADRLRRWQEGWRPAAPATGRSELAVRDPIDDSVHPWRLHLPPGPGPHPLAVILATPEQPPTKVRWPDWDGRLLADALAAGMAVIEIHPAGDRRWDGAAWRRIPLVLAQASRISGLDTSRGVTICAVPTAGTPYPRQPPSAAGSQPDWWRKVVDQAQPSSAVAHAGLAAFADAPFTLVVGTGEHAAARRANRLLADAFRTAWAAHAQALAPELPDTAGPAELAGRNLVLIGNPRSNAVLARLGLDLPVTWDHRLASGPDGFSALRSSGPAIALSARLADGRAVLILDGVAPPWGDGLPLADRRDRLLIPPASEAR